MKIKFFHFNIFSAFFLVVSSFLAAETKAQFPPQQNIFKDKVEKKQFLVSTAQNPVKIGETEISIVTTTTEKASPIYFRPHENEKTAAQAAALIVKKHGGKFVEIKSRADRLIKFKLGEDFYTFDPNRIFSDKGIAATLKNYGKTSLAAEKSVGDFVRTLLKDYLISAQPALIVAVHNNFDEGDLSIKTLANLPKTELLETFINPNRDIDDFFYVTTRRDFEFFKAKDFNVVLQNNIQTVDDGSLSVYCGKQNRRYINVEAEHGHLAEQIEMLESVQELMAEKNQMKKSGKITHSEPRKSRFAP